MEIKKVVNKNNYADVLSSTEKLTLYISKETDISPEYIILKTAENKVISIFSDIDYHNEAWHAKIAIHEIGVMNMREGWSYKEKETMSIYEARESMGALKEFFPIEIDERFNIKTVDRVHTKVKQEISEEFYKYYEKWQEFIKPEITFIYDEMIIMYNDNNKAFDLQRYDQDKDDNDLLTLNKLDYFYKEDLQFKYYIPQLDILVNDLERPRAYIDYSSATKKERKNAVNFLDIEDYRFVKYISECGMLIKADDKELYIIALDYVEFEKALIEKGKKKIWRRRNGKYTWIDSPAIR